MTGALVFILLLSSCGHPGYVRAPAPINDTFDLATALEDRYGTVGNSVATQKLIEIQPDLARCMSEAGFEYWPEDKAVELDFSTRMSEFMFASDAYPTDLGEARAEGFGVGTGLRAAHDDGLLAVDPAVPGREENWEYVNSLSPEAEGAYGAAISSCRTAFGQRLEEIHAIRDLAGQITARAREQMSSRADYSSMLSDWQACFSLRAIEVTPATPEQLRDLVMSWYFEEETLTEVGEPIAEDLFAELQAKEIEAAVTSVECGADEAFGVQLDQILGEEIGAEVARRGLDDS